jgi:hypothetical protein
MEIEIIRGRTLCHSCSNVLPAVKHTYGVIACIDKGSLKIVHDKLYQSVPRMGLEGGSVVCVWSCQDVCSTGSLYDAQFSHNSGN